MSINTEAIRDAAGVLDILTSNLAADRPFRAEADPRAKDCVRTIYAAADHIDGLISQHHRDSAELRRLCAQRDNYRRQAQYEADIAEAALAKTRELCAEKAELERIVTDQAETIKTLRKAGKKMVVAMRGLLDAVPSDTKHPAITAARAALSGKSNAS